MADDPRDPFDDEALAAAFRSGRTSSGKHLSETEWERLTCDEMTPAERDTSLVHIMGCAECTAIHRSLMQLREGARKIETARGSNTGSYYRRWSIFGGLATAAAIVAALLINQPTRIDPGDVTRSGRENAAVVVIAPQSNQPLVERRFAWQPVTGADRYELRVTAQDGASVFTSRRDETSAELPAEVQLGGGTYYWRVLAFKGDAEIAASPLIPFVTSRER